MTAGVRSMKTLMNITVSDEAYAWVQQHYSHGFQLTFFMDGWRDARKMDVENISLNNTNGDGPSYYNTGYYFGARRCFMCGKHSEEELPFLDGGMGLVRMCAHHIPGGKIK